MKMNATTKRNHTTDAQRKRQTTTTIKNGYELRTLTNMKGKIPRTTYLTRWYMGMNATNDYTNVMKFSFHIE
jgi:hypothetical protein